MIATVAMWISTELGAEFNEVFSGFSQKTTATCLRSVTIEKGACSILTGNELK